MGVNNAEGVNFKVITMGRPEIDNRKKSDLRPLTLDKIYEWIDSKPLEDRIKIELRKSASNYPQQALSFWQKNYSRHLMTIQNKLQGTIVPRNQAEKQNGQPERSSENLKPQNDEFN